MAGDDMPVVNDIPVVSDETTYENAICLLYIRLISSILITTYIFAVFVSIFCLYYNCSPYDCQYTIVNSTCKITANDSECTLPIAHCNGKVDGTFGCLLQRDYATGECSVSTLKCMSKSVIVTWFLTAAMSICAVIIGLRYFTRQISNHMC